MNFKTFYELEKKEEYFKELISFLKRDSQENVLYPAFENLFKAFEYCDFPQTKVVIIGQDPYHQPHQAHGLSFSVLTNKLPSSLQNIFKELNNDLGIENTSGDLSPWAKQGVLLLNTTLSVRESQPMSHKGKGWEIFTKKIIEVLNQQQDHLIFVLWGKHAQQFESIIDTHKHTILKSAHPSGLSAHRGFFNSQVFSKINTDLKQHHLSEIDWRT